jgi:ABC-2 type transport system permease protein
MPSSLTDPEMTSLVGYINRGKPTLVIDDPFPVFQPNLAPRNPKPRPGGMFGGGAPMQEKSDRGHATKLSSALGIQWDSGQTVWDRYDPHPEIREMLEAVQLPDVVYVSKSSRAKRALNPDSRITNGLQEVMMFYPGSISPAGGSNLKFEPLLESSPDSVTHEWEEYVSSGFMGMTQLLIPQDKGSMRDEKSRVIAARITGAAPGGKDSKSADIDVVFVAEMDMISNPFFFIRDKEWQGLKLDNITFVLNAVDELAGEHALLALRGRQAIHRTLTTIESNVKTFKTMQVDEAAKADSEAKDALDDVNKALQKDIDKIDADTSLDPQTKKIMKDAAVRNQQQVLDVKKANIENDKKRKVKIVKERTEREIRSVENFGRNLAIILPPIPALILGMFVFAYRLKGERQGIFPDRLVGKK